MSGSIHLCIATGQNLANLIPALQLEAREVWILQTPAMAQSASHLARALKRRQVKIEIVAFDDRDVEALRYAADDLAVRLAGQPVTVNLTGGTKLMTVALVQSLLTDTSASAADQRPELVYTDTQRRRIDRLAPQARSEPMKSTLKLDDVLAVQGYRQQAGVGNTQAAQWTMVAEARADLTRALGDEAGRIGWLIGALNRAAHQALNGPNGPFRREQVFRGRIDANSELILSKAQERGLLVWEKGEQIVFHDRDAAMYVGGGWIEEYAGLKVRGARADGGWFPRLEIEYVDTGSRNELDIALVHRNRMLLIECKAARPDADDRKVADWIYKVSQLAQQVGGSHATALLLSARDLVEEHRNRAQEYGVHVLAGHELNRLAKWLREWMDA